MIPKKHKEILRKVIDENGFDHGFTEDAVSFFWSEIRKHLSEMTHYNISISNLGIFTIKHWRLDEFVDTYEKHLNKGDAMTFQEAKYRKSMEKQYNNFLRIKKEFDKEAFRKLETKEKRRKYESAKIMGEQIQNNGGSSEQCDQEG